MSDHKTGFGSNSLQTLCDLFDIVNAVVDKIDLPASIEFSHHRAANQILVEPTHSCFNWHTIARRSGQAADISNPQQ